MSERADGAIREEKKERERKKEGKINRHRTFKTGAEQKGGVREYRGAGVSFRGVRVFFSYTVKCSYLSCLIVLKQT